MAERFVERAIDVFPGITFNLKDGPRSALGTQQHVVQVQTMTSLDRKDRLAILSLSVGHFINDAYSNFLGPLLPFLVPKLNLSIAEAGWLAAILVISSSFAQPLYGYISDRFLKRAFVVFSPLVTALFMSCLGL